MLGFEPRIARIIWTVVSVAALLFIGYTIRFTLLVLTFSIFFSYLLYPPVKLAERYLPPSVPRTVAIAVVFILVIAIVATTAAVFGTRIADEAGNLAQQLPKLLEPANLSSRIPLPHFLEPLRARVLSFLSEQLQTGTGQALPLVQGLITGILHAAGNLIYIALIPILSFLLIKDAPRIRAQALASLGTSDSKNRKLWTAIAGDLHLLLAGYVRALLLLSLATFVIYSLVFSMLGVPYALFLAGMSALLEFIPFVGPLISALAVLSVSGLGGYTHLLWLAAFFVAYRIFQDYVLAPYLMSEEVEVPPLLVILGLLAGEQLAGVVGMFLSVPVVAALKIILIRARAFAF
jgi:predicted PurR-regulated permease PerM